MSSRNLQISVTKNIKAHVQQIDDYNLITHTHTHTCIKIDNYNGRTDGGVQKKKKIILRAHRTSTQFNGICGASNILK